MDYHQYASEQIGSSGLQGTAQFGVPGARVQSETAHGMQQANEFIGAFAPQSWLPWLVSFMGRFIGPRQPTAPWQSPYDLDAGERITRAGSMPSGGRPFPYPYITGAVSGFMPMQDELSMQWGYAKNTWGPGVNTPVPIPWDAQYPQLHKVTG